ncbi:hypothetical protein CEXT_292051 [Caerostris extrusa]|uniref:Maturase K n=1 Tax=Caerostris extrusa TaxID=172846 RepID=A0AAV4TK47_CAEEX|nr:hypothetical protein CEXT_292051 [Caerostris extrusa]
MISKRERAARFLHSSSKHHHYQIFLSYPDILRSPNSNLKTILINVLRHLLLFKPRDSYTTTPGHSPFPTHLVSFYLVSAGQEQDLAVVLIRKICLS